MAQVTLMVAGIPYQFACRDGEEVRLEALAAVIDRKVEQLSSSLGRIGDAKLMLMAALLLLDEANDAEEKIRISEADLGAHVGALDELASAIEKIAERLESA